MIKILWTKRATKDLEKITKFNKEIFGAEKAFEISRNIIQVSSIFKNSITDYTKIGQIDDSFIHLKREYRKLITNYYKITYRISGENIYLIRVFDTRQNPTKNK